MLKTHCSVIWKFDRISYIGRPLNDIESPLKKGKKSSSCYVTEVFKVPFTQKISRIKIDNTYCLLVEQFFVKCTGRFLFFGRLSRLSLSRLTCQSRPVPLSCFQLYCSGCSALAVLSWIPCPGCLVPVVLCRLSCPCVFTWFFMSWLYCPGGPGCPASAVFTLLSCLSSCYGFPLPLSFLSRPVLV